MSDRQWLSSAILVSCLAGLAAAPLGAGDQTQPARLDKGMAEPKLVHKVPPAYPADAKKEGIQGTVVLDAVIAKDGSVRETRVKQEADARLVKAARVAVEQWRYEPVRGAQGEPIEVIFSVTIRFKLDGK